MTGTYRKLKRLLDELSQFDVADLDFGIYRKMKREREEGSSFLDNDRMPRACEEPEPSSSSVVASPK